MSPQSRYLQALEKHLGSQIYELPHPDPTRESIRFDIHQQEQTRNVLKDLIRQQREAVSIIASCGSGKTLTELNLIAASQSAKKELNINGNRKDLLISLGRATVQGVYSEFRNAGIDAGIWSGGRREFEAPVIVAGIEALQVARRRRELHKVLPKGMIDLCIVDEADCFLTQARKHLIDDLNPRLKVGFTATDQWPDGRTVYDYFGQPAHQLRLREGILRGINAVPDVLFYESEIEAGKIKMKDGDFDEKHLATALKHAEIHKAIGEVYGQLLETKEEREKCPTLIYVPSVALVNAVVETLSEKFGNEIAIVGWTGKDVTTSQLGDGMQSFKEGEIQVAVLCEMGGRGMNLENAKLMIDAYPTMSLNKLEQRHGRVLRKIRKGSKLYKMGWRKSSAVIAQIVPKSLQYRPALFTDIIGGYQQLQEIRAHAEKEDGENGPAEQDIVDVLRRRIEKKDPPHTVRLIREINALEEIKRYDQLPQADASGFFRIPRRYGKPPPTAEQK